jgi:hypothetical protein
MSKKQRVWWVVNMNSEVEDGQLIEADARRWTDGMEEDDIFDTEAEAIAHAKREVGAFAERDDGNLEASYTVYRVEAVAVVSSKISAPRVVRLGK